VPQLEFYDFDRRILGHDGWTSSRILQPGMHALEGAVLTVEAADDPGSPFAKRLQEAVQTTEGAEPTRFHVRGAQSMETVLFALDHGATDPEALAEALRLRTAWPERPEARQFVCSRFAEECSWPPIRRSSRAYRPSPTRRARPPGGG
jgi:hypothetical protein